MAGSAWGFRKRHTATCAECGVTVWDGQRCDNGHEDGPEARLRLSMGEKRAIEYVHRGMPDGAWDPNYWPGVSEADVALARRLVARWKAWAPLHEPRPSTDENPLFSPRFK